MSRIDDTFHELSSTARKGFIPFVTAGDPDIATSLKIIMSLAISGASIIELGVPFSDPMADGPTIQRSSQRSLAAGTNLAMIIHMVGEFRKVSSVPIVLFSYFNPLMRFGIDKLCTEAADAGIDGILITDAVGFEAADVAARLRKVSIDLISLIAPTTSNERLAEIAKNASGFLYAVSRAGVTGSRSEMTGDARKLVKRARAVTDLPVAVGFGISTSEQIREVWEYADAAVVGSAIVSEIEKAVGVCDPVEKVEPFVGTLVPEIAKRPQEV
ncbi:MAG TPA: tryptophan synthase subunit alpha [Pyrinomonadaceae bacterium]|nr:tryptophan synthase subunit alpha [Pyrinomonadaceae bacterium]